MRTCPKCGSTKTETYRHPYARIWCTECGFTIRDEGAHEYNEYKSKVADDCTTCGYEMGCTLKRERGWKPCSQYRKEKEKKC